MPSPQKRRVGVWTDYIGALGRGVLQGASRYALEKGSWQLFASSLFMLNRTPSWSEVHLDGLIIQLNEGPWVTEILRAGYPAINISEVFDVPELPRVSVDSELAGRLAAEHFLERGFTQFAFVGSPALYARKRLAGFEARVAQEGFTVLCSEPVGGELVRNRPDLFARLTQWVQSLPTPIGIFAANDIHALDVLEACSIAGISVPEQAAVLGMDNDELACQISHLRLSSIQNPAERIGYEAARMLDTLMEGGAAPSAPVYIQPTHIVTRPSTDILAIDDPDVSKAMQFIRLHESDLISVEDVLEHVPLSRRNLERRFRKLLGRSPLDEIRRIHIEQAKRLLVETDLQMPQVASKSGFGDATYLGIVFRRHVGMSPTHYRRRYRNSLKG